MKKLLLYFCLVSFLLFSGNVNAINTFKYSENKVSQELCYNLLEEFKFPTFPYEQGKPFTVSVELQIEDISKIDGKNLDFESFLLYGWIGQILELLKF